MRGQRGISTQWLAQVISESLCDIRLERPVVLAAAAIAATFALLTTFLGKRLSETTAWCSSRGAGLDRATSSGAAACAAMPVMVALVGGLIAAADRRRAPSFWLLPLIAVWPICMVVLCSVCA